MADLSAFPITRQFPAQHPDRLQLYSLPTPNGVKVSIMLEEIGLPYEVHLVDIMKNETWTPEYLSLNPTDPAARYETLQWVFWQRAAVGPMIGQMGFFHKFAGKDIEDKRPRDRFVTEAKRLLGVLEARLADRAYVMGDEFTIADIALIGWVRAVPGFYGADDLVDWASLKAVQAWVARCEARPAVARGLTIPARS